MYSMYSKTSKHVGSFALGVYNSEEISTEKKEYICYRRKDCSNAFARKVEKNLEGFTYFPKEK